MIHKDIQIDTSIDLYYKYIKGVRGWGREKNIFKSQDKKFKRFYLIYITFNKIPLVQSFIFLEVDVYIKTSIIHDAYIPTPL